MDIYKVVLDTVQKIESDDRFSITKKFIGSGVTDITVELPKILENFYKKSNGITFLWEYKNDKSIRGGINIPKLDGIYSSRWKNFGTLDYTDIHTLFQVNNDPDSRVLAESLEGDEDIDFMDLANGILTISDYFTVFSKTFGFKYWQEKYDENKEYSLDSIIENSAYVWG